MKTIITMICFLSCSVLVGCRTQSVVVAGDKSGPMPTAEYETVSKVTLWLGMENRIEATIEKLKDSIPAISGQKPRAKLIVKNLTSGSVIHEEECGDSSLSDPGFDIGIGRGLVMTTKGGSGDGISVYEVTESNARIVLEEGFRAAAITIPNDDLGGDMGFLIVDSESGTSPLVVRRYQYDDQGKKYVLTGKTPYVGFVRSIKAQFERAKK